jgi:hypothetical protein
MEHWWNETDRGKPNYSEKTLSQCHFAHHSSHIDWPESKPARRGGRPTANHVSHERPSLCLKPAISKIVMDNADRKGCSLLSSHIYKFPKFKFQNLYRNIDNEGWQAVTELSPFQPSVTHYEVSFAVPYVLLTLAVNRSQCMNRGTLLCVCFAIWLARID